MQAVGARASGAAFYLLVALLALCAGGKAILYDTIDPDAFWHLKVAEQIREEGVHPLVDRLSFASQPEPWTPYSWLAELGMKAVWDAGGYRLAVLVQAAMVAVFVVLVARAARAAGEGRLRAVVATAFASFLSLPYLSFRPATLAVVLLAGAYLVLQRSDTTARRSVLLLLPITALLANVHLYAFLVPLWVAGRAVAGPGRKGWTVVTIGCAAAACATPLLPGVIRTVLHYQFRDPMVAAGGIAEMLPFWRGPFGLVSAGLVLGFFACVVVQWHRLSRADLLLLAGSTVLLFMHGRYAPLFAIVAAPVLARTLPVSDRVIGRPVLRPALAALLAIGVVRLAVAFPPGDMPLERWLNRHGPETPGYPTAAAEQLAALRPARVINEFSWGGYLAWRGRGQYQVLLDGRTQCFSAAFWAKACLKAGAADRRGWLASLRADAAVLPVRGSLYQPFLHDLGWRCAYIDERAQVLVPPSFDGAADASADDR
jgi:hypothetical protein